MIAENRYDGDMGWWDLFYPKRCAGCGIWGTYLCEECVNKIRVVKEPICPMCEKGSFIGNTHPRCKRLWGLDGLVSVIVYTGVGKRLVIKYKYKYVKDLTDLLVQLIESFREPSRLVGDDWLVVPAPLHPRRERWRGFNQAAELGRGVAKYYGWEYQEGVLERTRYTKPQMELGGKNRRQNLSGAFALGKEGKLVKGRRVVLVDDVWTTGSTLRECGKVLKRAGVKEVWGLTLARA